MRKTTSAMSAWRVMSWPQVAPMKEALTVLCASGEMGEALAQRLGFPHVERVYEAGAETTSDDTRRAALGSFVYNVGEGQFSSSTLLRLLNAGDARGACAQLSRWVFAGGKQLAGLVNRRAAERELCEVGL